MPITANEYLMYPDGRDGDPIKNQEHKGDAENQLNGKGYPTKPKSTTVKIGDNNLLFWVRLPSRTKKYLWYDCIIMFTANTQEDFDKRLQDLPFKAFSNSPSFSYRYAKAFRDQNMLIGQFKYKFDEKILLQDPLKTNPDKKVGYERTIYTALLMQDQRGELKQPFRTVARRAKSTNWDQVAFWVKTQMSTETVLREGKDTKKEAARKKELEQRRNAQARFSQNRRAKTPTTDTTQKTKVAKGSSKTKTTKASSRTKTTAKVKKM